MIDNGLGVKVKPKTTCSTLISAIRGQSSYTRAERFFCAMDQGSAGDELTDEIINAPYNQNGDVKEQSDLLRKDQGLYYSKWQENMWRLLKG